MQAIAKIALAEQDLARLEVLDPRRFDDAAQGLGGHPRRDLRLDRPANVGFIQHPLDVRDRGNELVHRPAGRLDHGATGACPDRGTAPPPGNQAHFAKEFAGAKPDAAVATEVDLNLAFDDGVERIGVIVLLEYHLAGRRRAYLAVQQEFADLERRQRLQHRHRFLDVRNRLIHVAPVGDARELLPQ